MTLSLTAIAALTLVAFMAGLIDAIAGGGGLLTVPALLAAGLPPHTVFGTNKGSAVFGSGAALARFAKGGLIDVKRAPLLFCLGFFGSVAGAALLLLVQPHVLKPLVLVLLVLAAAVVVFVKPSPEPKPMSERAARLRLALLALGLGAYDGFFGPGTGTFLIVGLVTLLGLALPAASANAKVVNFASNLAAVVVFFFKGLILWQVSVPMAVGQLLGGTLGAHLAIKGGTRLIRLAVLAVVIALVTKLGLELL